MITRSNQGRTSLHLLLQRTDVRVISRADWQQIHHPGGSRTGETQTEKRKFDSEGGGYD
jgi:hypothetical protein